MSKQPRRSLAQPSTLVRILYERYAVVGKAERVIDHLESFVLEESGESPREIDPSWDTETQRWWRTARKVSSVDLLLHILLCLHRHMQAVTFDYLDLHQQCVGLLKRTQTELSDDLVKLFGKDYLPDPSCIACLPLAVFSMQNIQVDLDTPRKKARVVKGGLALDVAGKVFREFLSQRPAAKAQSTYEVINTVRPGASLGEEVWLSQDAVPNSEGTLAGQHTSGVAESYENSEREGDEASSETNAEYAHSD